MRRKKTYQNGKSQGSKMDFAKDSQKGNSKRASRKKAMDRDSIGKDEIKQSANDPSWYSSDPAILRDAASFPFSWPTGASDVHDISVYGSAGAPYSKVPGICSLRLVPSIGFCLRATDPINVAAQSIYSFVRHANSGHSNYDAPDLMLYILAMAQNYSFLVWCQRLYGYALTYDQRNRYIPNELIRVNNVDPDDLRNNLATFRFWINTFIAKMSSFAVPATYSIFSRMSFLYSDFYTEGTSIKDQLYQYVPAGFYKFDLDQNQAGMLKWVPFNIGTLLSVNDIITYGNTLFGAVWDQEDFGIMSGDILKSYGDRIIKLVSIPEYYTIAPKFDPMVLTQMKNAMPLDATPTNITQASGIIIQVVAPRNFTTSDVVWGTASQISSSEASVLNTDKMAILKDYKALTVDTDNPTPEIVMEASRLMYAYDSYLGEIRLGTEYLNEVVITYDINSDYTFKQCSIYSANSAATVAPMLVAAQTIKHFHYLPRLMWVGWTSTSGSQCLEWFDLDNFAILSNADLEKLHAAAVINMYAVPSVGKVQ